jgi:hypothetical protein
VATLIVQSAGGSRPITVRVCVSGQAAGSRVKESA